MKRAPNGENAANLVDTPQVEHGVTVKEHTGNAFNTHLPDIKDTDHKPVMVHADCQLRHRRHMNCRLNDSSSWFNRRLEYYQKQFNVTFGDPSVISTESVCAIGRIVYDTNDAKLTCKSAVLECAKGVGGGHRIPLDFSKYTDSVSIFPGQLISFEGTNQDGQKFTVQKILKPNTFKPEYAVNRPIKMAVSAVPLCTNDNVECFEPLEKVLEKTFDAGCDVLVLFGPIMNAGHASVISGKGMTKPPLDHYNHVMSRLSLLTTNSHCTVLLVLGPNDLLMDPVYPPNPGALPNLPPRVLLVDYSNVININGLRLHFVPFDILMHLSGEEVSQNGKGDRLTRLFEHILEQQCVYPLYPPSSSIPIDYDALPLSTPVPDVLITPSVLRVGVQVASNGSILVNPGRQNMMIMQVHCGQTPATSISIKP